GLAATVELATAFVAVRRAVFEQLDQRADRGAALAVPDHVDRVPRIPLRVEGERVVLGIAGRVGGPAFAGRLLHLARIAVLEHVGGAVVDAAALDLGVQLGGAVPVGGDRADCGGEHRVRTVVGLQQGGD